ncbi:aldose 1-epimerase [Oxyplasma meridianum]|uniref:Aldose 1-epimerase n=1 Tax=Oxyplasma meridianum TaxID=3073602 RepID=A0AAX4NIG9_9ARCH
MEIKFRDSLAEIHQLGAYVSKLFIDGIEILKESNDGKDTHGGSAVLIPYANRVRDHVYRFEGREYQLPANSGNHSIHGLVRHVKWDILKMKEDSVELGYALSDPGYPSRVHNIVKYSINNDSFTTRFEIENIGERDSPVMIGAHPYFLTHGEWDITADKPVKRLEYVDGYFPTGQMSDFSMHQVTSKSGTVFDNCFLGGGELNLHNGMNNILIERENMPYFQVYNGEYAEGKSVAIEPMTGAPNSFNNGIGLITMEPGGKFFCSYTISLIE